MSSLTKNLKLFKWDPKTDGSQKFNIPKALNENWDNIEEAMNNVQKTTQTTQAVEQITVTDCAGANAKLDIKNGKTIQNGTPAPTLPIDIRNVGDDINLFNKETITKATRLGTYGEELTGSEDCKDNFISDYIKVEGNTYYCLNYKITGNEYYKRIAYYDENKNFISANISSNVFKTPVNTKFLRFTHLTSLINEIKLKKGNIVTPYTPFGCGSIDFQLKNQNNSKNRIVSFPLSLGQVLHSGDYLAEDGIHQKKKTVVLDGTENWEYQSSTSDFSISSKINDIAIEGLFAATAPKKVKSNYFVSSNWYNLNKKLIDNAISVHDTVQIIHIRATQFTSLENFKNWLVQQNANGTPLTIEYELATEIVTPYTQEQRQAYYELQHLLMYEEYTNITCVNEIKPDIQLTYYYNNLLNNSYASRLDKVETITKKNIITASISSKYTITSSDAEKLILSNDAVKTGNKLSIVDGSILIGKGISYVKVSAQIYFSDVLTPGRKRIQIHKNNSIVNVTAQDLTLVYSGLNLAEKLVDVKEGDLISLYIKGVANDTIYEGKSNTFITVEVVE